MLKCEIFKCFYILALLHAMIVWTNPIAPDNVIEKITAAPLIGAMLEILDCVGGKDQLQDEINEVIAYVSSWRNNIPASLVQMNIGAAGAVAKICFVDGICWADKMLANPLRIQEAHYGVMAISIVQRYCPNIPTSKFHGYGRGKLRHYFSEWIQGQTLQEKVESNHTPGKSVKIPEKVVTSLAEFVYNLTTCPIPKEEMLKLELLPLPGWPATHLNASAWVRDHFLCEQDLFSANPSEKPFDGLDKMLLLSWVREHSGSGDQSFVLHYWDLRMPNIMIDEENNVIGILDWDAVAAVPLKLSAISIAQSFFPERLQKLGLKLDAKLDVLFRQELSRIEREKSLSSQWSQMFLHSKENRFLFDILRLGHNLSTLRKDYPDLLAEALYRSSKTLILAKSEWTTFVNEFYINSYLQVPEYSQYVEIQEALGLYGRSQFERVLRKLKRNVLKRWNMLVDNIWTKIQGIRRNREQ